MKVVTLLRGNEYLDSARSPTGLRKCAAHLRRTIFLALAGSRGGEENSTTNGVKVSSSMPCTRRATSSWMSRFVTQVLKDGRTYENTNSRITLWCFVQLRATPRRVSQGSARSCLCGGGIPPCKILISPRPLTAPRSAFVKKRKQKCAELSPVRRTTPRELRARTPRPFIHGFSEKAGAKVRGRTPRANSAPVLPLCFSHTPCG